jgi:hypothetical protein
MLRMPKTIIQTLYIMVILAVLPGCASPATAKQYDLTAEVQFTYSTRTPKPTQTLTITPTRIISPTRTPNPDIWISATALAARAVKNEATATLAPTANPEDWKNWQVVPVLSERALQVYKKGLELGNSPRAFSKVGNCQSVTTWFLGMFDDSRFYRLGPYKDLQATIDYFSGSFSRASVAIEAGWSIASVLNPYQVDTSPCMKKETPLSCELRLDKPSFVIISVEPVGPNFPADKYQFYLRQIVDYAISQGVLPILATKADNLEGDNAINRAIAQVASDYDLPLWNFWAAVQDIPKKGLQEDGFHLTGLTQIAYFDDSTAMTTGWARRNLTALQTFDMVRKTVEFIK